MRLRLGLRGPIGRGVVGRINSRRFADDCRRTPASTWTMPMIHCKTEYTKSDVRLSSTLHNKVKYSSAKSEALIAGREFMQDVCLPGFRFPPKFGRLKERKGREKQDATTQGATKNRSWSSETSGDPTEQKKSKHRNGYPLIDPEIEQVDW